MLCKTEGYCSCMSIDMRCFDNSKPDMGVGDYFEICAGSVGRYEDVCIFCCDVLFFWDVTWGFFF